jgi:hypothetical protein
MPSSSGPPRLEKKSLSGGFPSEVMKKMTINRYRPKPPAGSVDDHDYLASL